MTCQVAQTSAGSDVAECWRDNAFVMLWVFKLCLEGGYVRNRMNHAP